jgi:hypothetical protein
MREFISIPSAGPKREDDGTEKEETEEEKARKKARMAPLHREYVAPISFLIGAVESRDTTEFNITGVGKSFGYNHEAFARECYEELATEIYEMRSEDVSNERNASLFVIACSSGVGKSTSLAYFVARMKNVFKNVALCYASSKSSKTRWGTPVQDETECIVWLNNKLQFQGKYAHVKCKGTIERRATQIGSHFDGWMLYALRKYGNVPRNHFGRRFSKFVREKSPGRYFYAQDVHYAGMG